MKLTKKIALVSASLALGMAAPAVLVAENASVTLAATQATAVTVTKKTAPYYHKDGSKFTKAKPYKYGKYSSATTGKGANYKVIKTVTIKGAKYYYIGNDAYLKASDVKVTASKTVKAASSSKKTSTKTAAKKTTSTKTSAKSSSKKTAAKKTSTKKAATAKKAAVPAGTATNVTSVTVTKKTTPFYHADGSKFTKANPYKYAGWTSTVAYKNITFKVSKELTLKGAKYYYIGNNAYLKASDVKVASSKKAAAKKTTSTKKTAAKKTTSSKKTSTKSSSKTSSKKTSTKKAAKTVAAVKVAKKTVPYYHKDGSKFTKAKPYKYNGWSSTVAYKNVSYNVVKTVTIKGAKYYYIGNAAYLKASDVTVTKTK
ncbi:hypothetical protein [uncultured Lactobacillus sp.]|uniref:hypothetical protein n=1 Tax=uncultured Lactobacillus sp. TaxID=153152 RepID=UPI002665DEB3|nr:hypothetical protein [uncultured Lactobacillus sp.]